MQVLWIFKQWYYWMLVAFTVAINLISNIQEGFNPFDKIDGWAIGTLIGFFLWPFLIVLVVSGVFSLVRRKDKKKVNR